MRSAFASSTLAVCALAFLQCEDEATLYGSPDSMNGRSPAPPPGGYVVPVVQAKVCDAGVGTGDAGDCGVSFEREILGGSFKRLRCTEASCHGAEVNPPVLAGVSASAARAALVSHVLKTDATSKRLYVDPCDRNPAASSIMCNLRASAACASRMPPPPALPATDAELGQLSTWLACGAPDN